MNKSTFLIALGLLTGGVVAAQTKKVVADKIVGLVGDKIILRSDVVNTLSDLKRRSQDNSILPTECQILESQLIRKALVLQAQKDSVQVSEEDIEAQMDLRIRQAIMTYGSKELLEEIAGKTVYQIKEDNREAIREQKLSEEMQAKIVENVKITPAEVKAYYSKIPQDSLPYYESEIEVSQLVMYPKANKDVEEYVAKQLYDYKRQVENGGGSRLFDQLAKTYSEDPAVRENGGQYTLNRNDKGTWDPAFLSAAFKLRDGQVSPVVKSKFGLHILMMVARSGDEAIVKHILRIPPIEDIEIKETIAQLDSIRNQVVSGAMTFGAAVTKYSDDEATKYSAGAISGRDMMGNFTNFITIDQVDKDLAVLLPTLKPGDYSKPHVYVDERGRKVVRMVYLKNRTTPHRENLQEDYNRIAQRALEEKKNAVLEKWFKDHIPTYYVFIDKEYSGCPDLNAWRAAAAKAEQARTGKE